MIEYTQPEKVQAYKEFIAAMTQLDDAEYRLKSWSLADGELLFIHSELRCAIGHLNALQAALARPSTH